MNASGETSSSYHGAPSPERGDARLSRRRFLTAAASVVGAVGVGFAAAPFVAYMEPSRRTVAQGAPIDINLSKLETGQMITVKWRSKPIWVLRRSQQQLDTLAKMDSRLKDPDSSAAQQPADMQKSPQWHNEARALNPEYLVLVGICTHLGCIPEYRPRSKAGDLGEGWLGGFFCPCHGSQYDLSGRVIKGSPAPLNLPVPPYFFTEKDAVRVGVLKSGHDKNWSPAVW